MVVPWFINVQTHSLHFYSYEIKDILKGRFTTRAYRLKKKYPKRSQVAKQMRDRRVSDFPYQNPASGLHLFLYYVFPMSSAWLFVGSVPVLLCWQCLRRQLKNFLWVVISDFSARVIWVQCVGLGVRQEHCRGCSPCGCHPQRKRSGKVFPLPTSSDLRLCYLLPIKPS